MSSSVFFAPGRTSTTRQILNRQSLSGKNPTCVCQPPTSNKRVYNTSYNNSYTSDGNVAVNTNINTNTNNCDKSQIIVNPDNIETKNQRIARTVRHSSINRVQFGNHCLTNPSMFLGRIEGQPGGMVGPLRNKF